MMYAQMLQQNTKIYWWSDSTSRSTQSLINMNSCSETGIESANSSCWKTEKLDFSSSVCWEYQPGQQVFLCLRRAHLSSLLSGCALTILDFMAQLSTESTRSGFVGLKLLSDDGEVWLVGGQAQHDQISWNESSYFTNSWRLLLHYKWILWQILDLRSLNLTISSTQAVVCVGVMVRLSCQNEEIPIRRKYVQAGN